MYDVAVIGAGLGGLECAYLLAKKGMKVIVLEKNPVTGGCLQTFKRRGQIFDTGFHYIGGLDNGQPLNRIFKLFNLMDLLWQKLDEDCFDEVFYMGKPYKFKNGYESFMSQMTEYFPGEKKCLENYTGLLKNVGENIFDAFMRTQEEILNEDSLFSISALEYLTKNIENKALRNILSGTSPKMPLTDKLPLYHFAQINSSFIQSAYRIKGGGMQITDKIAENIKSFGGEILTKSKVVSTEENNGSISALVLENGEKIETKLVISNVHPAELMKIISGVSFVRAAQKRRYSSFENSFGMFTVNIALKKNSLKYLNRNIYIHEGEDIWSEGFQKAENPPQCALISYAVPENRIYAENIDILTPMLWQDVERFDNGGSPCRRSSEYNDFKAKKAEQVLNLASRYISGLKDAVENMYISTPLTYRDYISTADGAAYGILKKIPFQKLASNIYWTGQNIGLHGVLGVSMTALLTYRLITGEVPEL